MGVAVDADESDGLALGDTVGVDVAHADAAQLTVGVMLVGGGREELALERGVTLVEGGREELALTEEEADAEEHWDGMLGSADGDADPVAKPSHCIARTRLLYESAT